MEMHIESSNPEALQIKLTPITLEPEAKGKIQIVFSPVTEPVAKQYILTLKVEGKENELIGLSVNYS